jgi:predicted dehydrogenase
MTEVRVAIFGAGDNTRTQHMPNLQKIPGVTLVGVCNRTRESAERVANQFGIKKTYANYRELVADPGVNAVMIGTWPYMHCPVSVAALNAEKHVLCEARMAMNAAEAHAMREAARAHPELVAQIVPSPFTLRVDRTIQKLISSGTIGDPLAVEIRAGGAFVNRDAPLSWRQNTDYSGCNIMSLGIWYEAMLRWVGEAVSVSASGKVFQKMRKDESGTSRAVRIPEHVDVIADLACGAQLHMLISAVAGLAGPAEAFIFGSEGTLRFCENKLFSGRRGDKELKEVAIPPEDEGRWRVEEEFVNAIRGTEKTTHTTFDDGCKYMEFTEAVTVSMNEGRRVPLLPK